MLLKAKFYIKQQDKNLDELMNIYSFCYPIDPKNKEVKEIRIIIDNYSREHIVRNIKEISGPYSFIYFNNIPGDKKILLLGDRHFM